MSKPGLLLLSFSMFLYWSCNTRNKYPVAIKDFRTSLQPFLVEMVSKGVVTYYGSEGGKMPTDKELIQLGKSEHPILRAFAFEEMLTRKSFNPLAVIINHLDDTAIVATDEGEWGIAYRTVSDYMLSEAFHIIDRDKYEKIEGRIIDAVITKHNYLRWAYTSLLQIKPQEKYYAYVKDMATRERKSIGMYDDRSWYGDLELALYGLAKFGKKEDIEIIREGLLSRLWRMNDLSFRILKEYPDPAYLEVFEKYYPKRYYRSLCDEPNGEKAIDFINSLVVYKDERSARLLDSLLNNGHVVKCSTDTNWIRHKLIYVIWDNPCEAYSKLRRQIRKYVKEDEKMILDVDMDIKPDTTEVKFR